MSTGLARICLVTSSSSTDTHFNCRPSASNTQPSYYRQFHNWRYRQRRAQRALATPFCPWQQPPPHHPSPEAALSTRALRNSILPSTWTGEIMNTQPGPRYRGASRSAADRSASLDAVIASLTPEPVPPFSPSTTVVSSTPWCRYDDDMYDAKTVDGECWDQSVPQSPAPLDDAFETRSIRSMSSNSRNTNRLSITLPVAQPDSMPSRRTPHTSNPPTPSATPVLDRQSDPNDFIIAIAAQERKVLELREELSRAEGDLVKLKKQFTAAEGRRKKQSARAAEQLRPMAPLRDSSGQAIDDVLSTKHKSEMERRKAILLAQSQAMHKESKTRIIRGGHTRTLSLLSPDADSSIHSDRDASQSPASATTESQAEWQANRARKRATWAPRQTQAASGMKQMASELRQGLWTFVEDLRQATVGDEAISGTSNRTSEMAARLYKMEFGDQETIRASVMNRPRVPFPIDGSNSQGQTDAGDLSTSVQHRRSLSRPEPKSRKRFSWSPPSFDNIDDDDWSNWDTPSVKPARWSGSTANGDIIPAIPEKADEGEGTVGEHQSRSEVGASSPPSTSKLEELPQAILSKLTPSGLKGLPSQFMKDWERSLAPPTEPGAFEASSRDIHAVSQ